MDKLTINPRAIILDIIATTPPDVVEGSPSRVGDRGKVACHTQDFRPGDPGENKSETLSGKTTIFS